VTKDDAQLLADAIARVVHQERVRAAAELRALGDDLRRRLAESESVIRRELVAALVRPLPDRDGDAIGAPAGRA
jgi:hypothetical protein